MNQGSIKVEAFVETPFSDGPPDVFAGADVGQGGAETYRDLLKVLMSVSDGLECKGDPFDLQRYGPKNHIYELCRLGEIKRTRPRLD